MGIFSGKLNAAVFVDDAQVLISTFEEWEKTTISYANQDIRVVVQKEIGAAAFTSIDTLTEIVSGMGFVSLRQPYDPTFPAIEILDLSLKDLPHMKNSGLEDKARTGYLFGVRKDERKVSSSLKAKKFEEAMVQQRKNGAEQLGSIERKELKEKIENELLKKTAPSTQIIECLLVPEDGILYVFASGKILDEITSWLRGKFNCILDMQPLLQWGTQEVSSPNDFREINTSCSPEMLTHKFLLWMLYSLYKKGQRLPENLQPTGSFTLQREKDLKTVVEYNEESIISEDLLYSLLKPFRSEDCKAVSGKFEFLIMDCFSILFSVKGALDAFPVLICPKFEKVLALLAADELQTSSNGELLERDEFAENCKIRYFLMRKGYDTCRAIVEMYVADKKRDDITGWL